MKKTSIILLLFSFFLACGGKQELFKVIEKTFKDGSPHIIKYYQTDEKKNLIKETIYYESGKKKVEGTYSEAKKDGSWTAWFPSGKIWSEAVYSEGVENGLKTVYYDNGNKYYAGNIKEDKRIGEWSFWNKEGKLLKKVNY